MSHLGRNPISRLLSFRQNLSGKVFLQQHQLINQVLAEDLAGPVHALSIQAKTPTQWEHSGHAIRDTPECLGGKKA